MIERCGEGDGGGGEREKRAFAFRKAFPATIIFIVNQSVIMYLLTGTNRGPTRFLLLVACIFSMISLLSQARSLVLIITRAG